MTTETDPRIPADEPVASRRDLVAAALTVAAAAGVASSGRCNARSWVRIRHEGSGEFGAAHRIARISSSNHPGTTPNYLFVRG